MRSSLSFDLDLFVCIYLHVIQNRILPVCMVALYSTRLSLIRSAWVLSRLNVSMSSFDLDLYGLHSILHYVSLYELVDETPSKYILICNDLVNGNNNHWHTKQIGLAQQNEGPSIWYSVGPDLGIKPRKLRATQVPDLGYFILSFCLDGSYSLQTSLQGTQRVKCMILQAAKCRLHHTGLYCSSILHKIVGNKLSDFLNLGSQFDMLHLWEGRVLLHYHIQVRLVDQSVSKCARHVLVYHTCKFIKDVVEGESNHPWTSIILPENLLTFYFFTNPLSRKYEAQSIIINCLFLIIGLCNIIGLPIYCNILVSNTYRNTFFRIAIRIVFYPLFPLSYFKPVQV